ncbi:hypothetical protein Y1Q_0001306 [Alligator mississippiensis]|uniref:Uncharacterized protein n=1 Tax=Alligator mississippiensis TaxID=8496 RepID=A0A151M8Z9_ALLMI|nr:hypothetical protein Y1Q_0001306 [Alligator mississippiensis]
MEMAIAPDSPPSWQDHLFLGEVSGCCHCHWEVTGMRAGPEKIVQVPREEVASVRKPLYPETPARISAI